MWPVTAFSVARGSIQEKSTNLKFDEKCGYICVTELLALDKMHLHKNNAFSVYHFVLFIYLFYDQIRRYGLPLTLRWGT